MEKKSELEKFLLQLSDHELAIYIGYNFDSLMPGSREKVLHEANKRGLKREQLEKYFYLKLPISPELLESNIICPRCGSEHIFVETDYEHRPAGRYSSVDVAVDTCRCRLCGYNPDKEVPKNIIMRIRRIFKNNKRERVVKWDSW
ncbi:MAG: hypothetical protein JXB34_08855 [Bacteroidales bacterium]|nr:hypothetical protein [Bacteroidales bacterium]